MQATNELRALLKAIRRLARALDIQSRRIDRAAGLTLPQYIVLTAARDLGNGTSREIARESDLSPATVVGILDKLEAKGLVARLRSTTDRRSVHTRVTGRGAATLDRLEAPLGAEFAAAFAALPEPDRRTMLATLHHLAALAAPDEDTHEDAQRSQSTSA